MKLYLTSLFLFSYVLLFSQYEISSKVVDNDKLPVPNTEVKLLNSDSITITSTFTNTEGRFILHTEQGKYILQVDDFVNEVLYKNIEVTSNLDLGVLQLLPANQLSEVVATAKKPLIERKGDRIIYNVGNSILANGVSGDILLKSVPRIDPTSDDLKIIGKSSVRVMVNGKFINLEGKDIQNYIKSLQSENIEKIEVITSPSAKYDATGNSGIINIILKKKINLGFDGNIGVTYKQRSYPTLMETVNLNYSNKKFIIQYRLFNDNEKSAQKLITTYYFSNQTRNSLQKSINQYDGLSNSLDIEYQLSKIFKIGLKSNYNRWKNGQTSNDQIRYILNSAEVLKSQFLPSSANGKRKYGELSPYIEIALDSLGSKFIMNYDYINSENFNNSTLNEKNYTGDFEGFQNESSSKNNINNNYKINSLIGDLEFSLDQIKVETGAKFSKYSTNNLVSYYSFVNGNYVLDTNLSNHFLYDEEITAAYANLNSSLGEKFYLQLGFRFESTQTNGNSLTLDQAVQKKYSNLFPNFFISFDPNDDQSFSLSYNKRISRPALDQLNPFRIYSSANHYFVGNANLKPSLTDNIELGYTIKNNLSFALFSTKISDNVAYLDLPDGDNEIIKTVPLNILTTYNTGLDIGYNWKISSRINSFNSFNIYYEKSNSTDDRLDDHQLKGTNASIGNFTTYTLGKENKNKLMLQIYYAFPGIEEMYYSKNIFMFKFGGSFNFLKDKLNMSIFVTDPFNTTIGRSTVTYAQYLFKSRINNYNPNYSISLTYKFGNNKSRDTKELKNSDKDRIKNEK